MPLDPEKYAGLKTGAFSTKTLKDFCRESPEDRIAFLKRNGYLFLLYRLSIGDAKAKETLHDYLINTEVADLFKTNIYSKFYVLYNLPIKKLENFVIWFAELFDQKAYREKLKKLPLSCTKEIQSFFHSIFFASKNIVKICIEKRKFFEFIDFPIDYSIDPHEYMSSYMSYRPHLGDIIRAPWAVNHMCLRDVKYCMDTSEYFDEHKLYFLTHLVEYQSRWWRSLYGEKNVVKAVELREVVLLALHKLSENKQWNIAKKSEWIRFFPLTGLQDFVNALLKEVENSKAEKDSTFDDKYIENYLLAELQKKHYLTYEEMQFMARYYQKLDLIPKTLLDAMGCDTVLALTKFYPSDAAAYNCIVCSLKRDKSMRTDTKSRGKLYAVWKHLKITYKNHAGELETLFDELFEKQYVTSYFLSKFTKKKSLDALDMEFFRLCFKSTASISEALFETMNNEAFWMVAQSYDLKEWAECECIVRYFFRKAYTPISKVTDFVALVDLLNRMVGYGHREQIIEFFQQDDFYLTHIVRSSAFLSILGCPIEFIPKIVDTFTLLLKAFPSEVVSLIKKDQGKIKFLLHTLIDRYRQLISIDGKVFTEKVLSVKEQEERLRPLLVVFGELVTANPDFIYLLTVLENIKLTDIPEGFFDQLNIDQFCSLIGFSKLETEKEYLFVIDKLLRQFASNCRCSESRALFLKRGRGPVTALLERLKEEGYQDKILEKFLNHPRAKEEILGFPDFLSALGCPIELISAIRLGFKEISPEMISILDTEEKKKTLFSQLVQHSYPHKEEGFDGLGAFLRDHPQFRVFALASDRVESDVKFNVILLTDDFKSESFIRDVQERGLVDDCQMALDSLSWDACSDNAKIRMIECLYYLGNQDQLISKLEDETIRSLLCQHNPQFILQILQDKRFKFSMEFINVAQLTLLSRMMSVDVPISRVGWATAKLNQMEERLHMEEASVQSVLAVNKRLREKLKQENVSRSEEVTELRKSVSQLREEKITQEKRYTEELESLSSTLSAIQAENKNLREEVDHLGSMLEREAEERKNAQMANSKECTQLREKMAELETEHEALKEQRDTEDNPPSWLAGRAFTKFAPRPEEGGNRPREPHQVGASRVVKKGKVVPVEWDGEEMVGRISVRTGPKEDKDGVNHLAMEALINQRYPL